MCLRVSDKDREKKRERWERWGEIENDGERESGRDREKEREMGRGRDREKNGENEKGRERGRGGEKERGRQRELHLLRGAHYEDGNDLHYHSVPIGGVRAPASLWGNSVHFNVGKQAQHATHRCM